MKDGMIPGQFRNTYLLMRHGEADNNIRHIISSSAGVPHHVTELGREQVVRSTEAEKSRGITVIVTSPLLRTRESAEIVADILGIPRVDIIVEDRFKEWQLGALNGRPVGDIKLRCPTLRDRFTTACGEGAETLVEMQARIADGLRDLDERFSRETILIVGHEYTLWLAVCAAEGADIDRAIEIRGTAEDFVKNGEVIELASFIHLTPNP